MAIIFCRNTECNFNFEGKCDAEILKMKVDAHDNNVCDTFKSIFVTEDDLEKVNIEGIYSYQNPQNIQPP